MDFFNEIESGDDLMLDSAEIFPEECIEIVLWRDEELIDETIVGDDLIDDFTEILPEE